MRRLRRVAQRRNAAQKGRNRYGDPNEAQDERCQKATRNSSQLRPPTRFLRVTRPNSKTGVRSRDSSHKTERALKSDCIPIDKKLALLKLRLSKRFEPTCSQLSTT